VNYPDPNVKEVRADERDVPKVDWYKLSLNFIQVLVDQPFVLQLGFECHHSPFGNESISI
jgi:hypothetical protein